MQWHRARRVLTWTIGLAGAVAAAAQAQGVVTAGDSIRFLVTGNPPPHRYGVVLAGSSADSIVFVEDGAHRSVSVRTLAHLDRWQARRGTDDARNGAIIGGIIGAIAGGLLGPSVFPPEPCPVAPAFPGSSSGGCRPSDVQGRATGAAVGGILGIVIGVVVGTSVAGHWEPVELRDGRVGRERLAEDRGAANLPMPSPSPASPSAPS